MTTELRVGIVGLGPRGLSALERVVSLLDPVGRVRVIVFEPGEPGVGVHWRDQPEYLMLNTVAAQATALADPGMVDGAPCLGGEDFLSWCARHDVRAPVLPGHESRPVAGSDFLPRRVFGDYLSETAEWLLDEVASRVSLELIREHVVDVRPQADAALITTAGQAEFIVDLAVVTTGHGLPEPANGWLLPGDLVAPCYPLPDTVASIPAGAGVGVAGMGLAAIDVIAALTEGRGGRFSWSDGTLHYHASGEEPRIELFSRTGWLSCARPAHPREQPKGGAVSLTSEHVRGLRAQRPNGQLTTADVRQLLREEVLTADLTATERRAAEDVLGGSDHSFASARDYQDTVLSRVDWDIAEGLAGLGTSRFKEALEALRDHREVLREIVRSPGMAPEAHRAFFDEVPGIANRAAVGPQIDRLMELVAVVRSGVASISLGPSPDVTRHATGWTLSSRRLGEPREVGVDYMVNAHLPFPSNEFGRDPLRRALLAWSHPHPAGPAFLDLTRDGFLRHTDGTTCESICVFGPPAEGANYYNNYVLWPGYPSRVLLDIDRAIRLRFGVGEPLLQA